jgi:hypothetical protein
MQTVLEIYKNTPKTDAANVLGIVRVMFPDITVETFLEQRMEKKRKRTKIARAKNFNREER